MRNSVPFRQGGQGTGERIATGAKRPRNDRGFYKGGGGISGGRTEASAPTEAQQEVQWAGDRKGRPYGNVGTPA